MDLAAAEPKSRADLGDLLEIPIAAEKDAALGLRQPGQEAIDGPGNLFLYELPLRAFAGRNELGKLVQRQIRAAAAPLSPVLRPPAVDGLAPGQLSQISPQMLRAPGRNAVPGAEPGVVDAFLGVLLVVQNVSGDVAAVSAVFLCAPVYGVRIPPEIQLDDLSVVHRIISL